MFIFRGQRSNVLRSLRGGKDAYGSQESYYHFIFVRHFVFPLPSTFCHFPGRLTNEKGKALLNFAFPGYNRLRSVRGYSGANPPNYKDTTTIVLQRTLLSERALRPSRYRAPAVCSSYARHSAILMPVIKKPCISGFSLGDMTIEKAKNIFV